MCERLLRIGYERLWKISCDIDRRSTAGFRKIDCRMKVDSRNRSVWSDTRYVLAKNSVNSYSYFSIQIPILHSVLCATVHSEVNVKQ